MKVLVACEYSGTVRDAFIRKGHRAVSCDILPTDVPGPHYQGSVLDILNDGWDLMIAHPPCTYLSNSSSKHLYLGMKKENGMNGDRWARMGHGAAFFLTLWEANIPKIAIENPIMLGHPKRLFGIPEQTQVVQPWQFGHGETNATCLWLKNLPPLEPTDEVEGRDNRIHRMPPGPDRAKERSKTFSGIADAMADQWG